MSEERTCECVMDLRKYRGVAVVLALLFGAGSWLYTYKYDKWKFWIGEVISIIGWICAIFTFGLTLLLPAFIHLWAVLEALLRSSEFYDNYYLKR